jgi:glycosyltransferase involved in cell wall biosynthesis
VIGGLVSVVMPAHDEETFIAEAIESVFAQTYRHFELIVVDDGSSDQTGPIAAGFDGVRVVRRPSRGWPAAARNTGLAVARGEYWTILDADDVMPPERLRCQVESLESSPQLEMVLGLTEAFVTPGEPRPTHWNPIWDNGPYHGHPCTCLARRTVLDRVAWFDESLQLGADIQWMARAKRAGVSMKRIGQLCLRYRIHAGNITSDVHTNRSNMLTALRTARRERPAQSTND